MAETVNGHSGRVEGLVRGWGLTDFGWWTGNPNRVGDRVDRDRDPDGGSPTREGSGCHTGHVTGGTGPVGLLDGHPREGTPTHQTRGHQS